MSEVVLEGLLSGHQFVEVLQLVAGKRQPLKIEVFDEAQLFGEVYLDGTSLLDVRVEQLHGLHALRTLLCLGQGRFRVVRERLTQSNFSVLDLDAALLDCASLEDVEPDEGRETLASEPPLIKP